MVEYTVLRTTLKMSATRKLEQGFEEILLFVFTPILTNNATHNFLCPNKDKYKDKDDHQKVYVARTIQK